MGLTVFGKAVRKARIDANVTLSSMAKSLGVSCSFLSGIETGRKKIPMKWVIKISKFFKEKNIEIANLQELMRISNNVIPIAGLPMKQKILLTHFAKLPMTKEQLAKFDALLKETNTHR